MKRTAEQWLALFEAQARSGLSQARFCKEQGLCPKYFSLRRRQLNGADQKTPFVRVRRAKPGMVETSSVEWQLQIGEVRVRVLHAPVDQVLRLLKGLA